MHIETAVAEGLAVGGEHYVSLAYKVLFARGLPVAAYPLQHFMQWGTPGDLAEYERWSDAFARLAAADGGVPSHEGMVLLPMAGLGSRFAKAGFALPKPLIPVSGRPMAVQAAADLPVAPRRRFVVRDDLPMLPAVMAALREAVAGAETAALGALTDGQARSCVDGLVGSGVAADEPLTIGACDNGMIYDPAAFRALMAAPDCDVIVWAIRGHPHARRFPAMFGWVDADEAGRVAGVSVKVPLADPARDPIVVGAFTFKRAGDFLASCERMFGRGALVNGEYYVDTCINDAVALGLGCRVFTIDHYLGWGTPDDLATFEYWQSCFHQWASHPYRLEKDRHVPAGAVAALAERYTLGKPVRPVPRGVGA